MCKQIMNERGFFIFARNFWDLERGGRCPDDPPPPGSRDDGTTEGRAAHGRAVLRKVE